MFHKLCREDGEEFTHNDPVRIGSKRKSHEDYQGLENCHSSARNSPYENQVMKCKPTYPKLKLRVSRKAMGVKIVGPDPQCSTSFKVDERIEILCQNSGLRGCWFRCKVLQVSQKRLKVQYDDMEDVEGSENLEV